MPLNKIDMCQSKRLRSLPCWTVFTRECSIPLGQHVSLCPLSSVVNNLFLSGSKPLAQRELRGSEKKKKPKKNLNGVNLMGFADKVDAPAGLLHQWPS